MEISKYNEAAIVIKKLDELNYQLGVLKDTSYTSIRFGTNYNVSTPINISEDLFNKIKELAIEDLNNQISPLSIKFDHL